MASFNADCAVCLVWWVRVAHHAAVEVAASPTSTWARSHPRATRSSSSATRAANRDNEARVSPS